MCALTMRPVPRRLTARARLALRYTGKRIRIFQTKGCVVDLPSFVWFILGVLSLAWIVFSIVVMVNVLMLAKAATPYFERLAQEQWRAELNERTRSLKHIP